MRLIVGFRHAWLPSVAAFNIIWFANSMAHAQSSDADGGVAEQTETPPDAPRLEQPPTAATNPYSAKGTAKATEPLPDIHSLGGSVQRIDDKTLRAMSFTNPERVLQTVPGVTVRVEGGYGLRPNIGIRGANSHRSRRITLLEDGVLQAYAPYSSPSTFSLVPMTRVVGIDVIKGPSALLYGPQTIAGAIDFRTRDVARGPQAFAEMSYGLRDYSQAHVYASTGDADMGVSLEGVETRVNGFQDIDYDRGSNGFNVGDYALRAFWRLPGAGPVRHRLSTKLVYQHERSNETYLGLTDADFADDPNRRYLAGALDEFRRHSTQIELRDQISLGEDGKLDIVAYRHDTRRAWYRLDRFRDGTSINKILTTPSDEANSPYLQLLRGDTDTPDPQQALVYVNNDWRYVSEGVQLDGSYKVAGVVRQEIRAGLRLHYDSFDRSIHSDGWLVQDKSLVRDGAGRALQNDDLAQALAFSGYVSDAVSFGAFTVTPGIRFEHIMMDYTDSVADTKQSANFTIALPGVSVSYAPIDPLRIFAGVHRGFSPPLPQDAKRSDPETAVNYELGARYLAPSGLQLELAGFFSDYDNMTSLCTLTAGCNMVDRVYNNGRVLVGGLEAGGGYSFRVGREASLPVRVSYTFTDTSFRSTFSSADPQLGDVERGDKVPYVPMHQASILTGLVFDRGISFNVQGTYVGAMREEASQGDGGRRTGAQWLLDLAASWRVLPRLTLTARAENVLAQQPVVSRRPWGARPLAPFHAQVGVRVDL